MQKVKVLWIALALILVGTLLLGCGGSDGGSGEEGGGKETESGAGSTDYPVKDPSEPFVLGEQGTVTLTNEQEVELQVQDEDGNPAYVFIAKKGAVIESSMDFTLRTFEADVPEDLAEQYVPVGGHAFELYVLEELGYGFSLRPKLRIHFTEQEIDTAKEAGASLDTIKGNLIVLYKEQRSPSWRPQMGLTWDQEGKTVTVSNLAAAGAWRLVAKKWQ